MGPSRNELNREGGRWVGRFEKSGVVVKVVGRSSTLITNKQWNFFLFYFYLIKNKFCSVLTQSISVICCKKWLKLIGSVQINNYLWLMLAVA